MVAGEPRVRPLSTFPLTAVTPLYSIMLLDLQTRRPRVRSCVFVLVGLFLACSGPDAESGTQEVPLSFWRPGGDAQSSRTYRGVRYAATVRATPVAFPQAVEISVSAFRAGSDRPRALPPLESPPITLQVARPGEEGFVWSSARSCRPDTAAHRLECGPYPVPSILGDSLASDRYALRVVLHLHGDTLVFPGETAFLTRDTLPPVNGLPALRRHLTFRAQTAVIDDPRYRDSHRLEIQPTVHNHGTRRVELHHSPCPVVLRLYRGRDTTAPAAWRRPAGWCEEVTFLQAVAPGETATLARLGYSLTEILGDSLEPGRYTLGLDLEISTPQPAGGVGEVADTTIRLRARELVLRNGEGR